MSAPPRGKYFYYDFYLRQANDMTALQPLQAIQTVKEHRIAVSHHAIDLASSSEDESGGGNEVEESEMELVEASTSKTRVECGKASAAKAKAMLKRMTVAPKYPTHLCGLLTRQVDLVRTWLMEIHSTIRALEVEHEGLLVKVTKIMEELDSDDL
jgi:hypothetical protein